MAERRVHRNSCFSYNFGAACCTKEHKIISLKYQKENLCVLRVTLHLYRCNWLQLKDHFDEIECLIYILDINYILTLTRAVENKHTLLVLVFLWA